MSKLIKITTILDKNNDFFVENFNRIDWSDSFELKYKDKKLNAKRANEIISKVEKTLEGIDLKALDSFDAQVDKIKEIILTERNLIELKEINCSRFSGRRGKNSFYSYTEKLTSKVNNLLNQLDDDKLTVIQQLITTSLNGQREFGNSFFYYDLPEYYDVVKDDNSKMEQEHKEVNSFDYNKYGLNKEEVVEKYNEKYFSELKRIEAFKAIKENAGDEIIIWSDQKISLRLTKLGFKESSWFISEYVKQWKDHLKNQGVNIAEKMTSIEKAEVEFQKGLASQDKLFKLFKQGSSNTAYNAISKMNLETLTKLMDSPLKCVTKRSKDVLHLIVNRVMELLNGGTQSIRFIKRLNRDADTEKRIYNSIVSFLRRHEKLSLLKIDYFYSNAEHMDIQDFIDFIGTLNKGDYNYKSIELNDEIFEKILIRIPKAKQLILHPAINAQFIKRMSVQEKLKALKNEEYTKIFNTDFESLFADVPWNDLKEVIKDSKRRKYFLDRTLRENDLVFLKRTLIDLDNNQDAKYFQPLSYKDKIEIIKASNKKQSSDYYFELAYKEKLEKIFTKGELVDLFKKSIKIEEWFGYSAEIAELLPNEDARKIILEEKEPTIDLKNATFLQLIVNDLELSQHVLNVNELPSLTERSYGYGYSRNKHDSAVVTFLRSIKTREYAEEIFGENFLYSQYALYLGQILTKEELIDNAENSNEFLRKNLSYLPDDYLNKFKDPKVYKEAVGNRVYRDNKSFDSELSSRLEKIAA